MLNKFILVRIYEYALRGDRQEKIVHMERQLSQYNTKISAKKYVIRNKQFLAKGKAV